MSYTIVIPARYGSTRLPGKPLIDIAGKCMIQRVWEQACRSNATEVVIATDDERIRVAADGFGARVCMTSPDHPSGTDRLQQVAAEMGWDDQHIVVNVQGDEPLIPPPVIDQVTASSAVSVATLVVPSSTVKLAAEVIVGAPSSRSLTFTVTVWTPVLSDPSVAVTSIT